MAFAAASLSLAAVYAASAAPIPLYARYSQLLGLTGGDLALTAAAYFFGCMVSLLMFARLSDHLGRKTVGFAVLTLATAGCVAFLHVSDATAIFLGRLLQGLSCGLASSALAALAVESAPRSRPWVGAAVASGAPMIGLSLGVFGAAALKEAGNGSLALSFEILIGVLAACALMLIFAGETTVRRKGALASLVPRVRVPGQARPYLPAAACTFIGTWAVAGFTRRSAQAWLQKGSAAQVRFKPPPYSPA